MILGVILACSIEGFCLPIPNLDTLYESVEACEAEGNAVIDTVPPEISATLYCYETNFFEEI